MIPFQDLAEIERRRERLWLLLTTCLAALSIALLFSIASKSDEEPSEFPPTTPTYQLEEIDNGN